MKRLTPLSQARSPQGLRAAGVSDQAQFSGEPVKDSASMMLWRVPSARRKVLKVAWSVA